MIPFGKIYVCQGIFSSKEIAILFLFSFLEPNNKQSNRDGFDIVQWSVFDGARVCSESMCCMLTFPFLWIGGRVEYVAIEWLIGSSDDSLSHLGILLLRIPFIKDSFGYMVHGYRLTRNS